MIKLYKFVKDFGRMGYLSGLFIAHEDDVKDCVGKEVYFGEVLGKHSEITTIIEKQDIKEITDDQDLIEYLRDLFTDRNLCGYNPLDYMEE